MVMVVVVVVMEEEEEKIDGREGDDHDKRKGNGGVRRIGWERGRLG